MFIEKICVATDGSDVAVRAAQVAVILARTGAARMVACSVAQPPPAVWPDGTRFIALDADLARALKGAQAHVATVARIAHAGGVSCEMVTSYGRSPAHDIVRTAEERGCDLILMGAHGPNDGKRTSADGTVQNVLAWSSVPVILYRDPREASRPEFSDQDWP